MRRTQRKAAKGPSMTLSTALPLVPSLCYNGARNMKHIKTAILILLVSALANQDANGQYRSRSLSQSFPTNHANCQNGICTPTQAPRFLGRRAYLRGYNEALDCLQANASRAVSPQAGTTVNLDARLLNLPMHWDQDTEHHQESLPLPPSEAPIRFHSQPSPNLLRVWGAPNMLPREIMYQGRRWRQTGNFAHQYTRH